MINQMQNIIIQKIADTVAKALLHRIFTKSDVEVDENLHIVKLGLSVRAHNVLKTNNINTVGEILKKGKDELSVLKNCGKRTLEEIERALANFGFLLE